MSYLGLLKNSDYRKLWVSQAISTTGDWLIVGLVIDLAAKLSGGSSSAVGALMSFRIIPALVLGAVIGVLVDRFQRRGVMIVSDLARAGLVLALAFAGELWQIYLLVFLTETFSLMFVPARNAMIPSVVGPDSLAEANSLSYTTDQVTMFLGLNFGAAFLLVFEGIVARAKLGSVPVLGPYFADFLGAQAGLTLDAISFLLSGLLIWLIKAPPSQVRYGAVTPALIGRDVKEGFAFLKENRSLRSTMFAVSVAALGIGTVYTAGYAYTADVLGYGKGGAGFTMMIGVFAFGMLVGAVISAPVGKAVGHSGALTYGLLAFGLGLFGFALAESRLLAGVLTVFCGAGMAVLYVNGWTYLQESVDDRVRGRVFVTMEMLMRVSLLVSLTASGALADALRALLGRANLDTAFFNGPRLTLLAGAVVILAAALLMRSVTREVHPPGVQA